MKMEAKTKLWNYFCLTMVLSLFGCAGTPASTSAQTGTSQLSTPVAGMDLDRAVKEAALQMDSKLPQGTKVALVSLASPSAAFSEQVMLRLESALVSSGKVVVVDRANLDKIRAEQGFQLSGEVDDDSAKAIGKLLGAGAIVTGSTVDMGDVYGLALKAINIETATVAVSYLAELTKTERIKTLMASGGNRPAVAAPVPAASAHSQATAVASTMQAVPARTEPPTTASPQPTAPAPALVVYKIGDTGPAGGIIFYDKGNSAGGWRYLEAAPATTETMAQWRHNSGPLGEGMGKAVGDTSKEIGMGQTNTQTIMRYFSQNGGGFGLAAQVCAELMLNGFNDWFLPSQDELSYMYGNLYRKGLGGFRNEWYYSSTTRSRDGYPVRINFLNGEPDYGESAVSRRVRAARRF